MKLRFASRFGAAIRVLPRVFLPRRRLTIGGMQRCDPVHAARAASRTNAAFGKRSLPATALCASEDRVFCNEPCMTTLVSTRHENFLRSGNSALSSAAPMPSGLPRIPRVVGNAELRAQQQRIQELLAELPMAEPELPVDVATERQSVDEHRPHTSNWMLYAVASDKRHVVLERLEIQVELQQRGRLQCRETATRKDAK